MKAGKLVNLYPSCGIATPPAFPDLPAILTLSHPPEPIIPHERKPQATEPAGGTDSGEGMHMKRMIAAAVAVIGLATMASAQTPYGPIQGVAAGGCAGCATAAPAAANWGPRAGPAMGGCRECDPKFGLAPFFKKLMFWKKDNACGSCGRLLAGFGGCKGGNCGGGAGAAFNPYPGGVPGTLVFPYNPYIRSPRDWYEK